MAKDLAGSPTFLTHSLQSGAAGMITHQRGIPVNGNKWASFSGGLHLHNLNPYKHPLAFFTQTPSIWASKINGPGPLLYLLPMLQDFQISAT